jgi:hypothetical protein
VIRNVHERHLPVPAAQAGALIDTLAGPADRLWPVRHWPAQRFDRPLRPGATGGHGPVRYDISEYEPGRRIVFRFRAPTGFHGHHGYEALPDGTGGCRLRHELILDPRGRARLTWPLIYRPLHDALIEDSLLVAARNLGVRVGKEPRWSLRVRVLRFLAALVGAANRGARGQV